MEVEQKTFVQRPLEAGQSLQETTISPRNVAGPTARVLRGCFRKRQSDRQTDRERETERERETDRERETLTRRKGRTERARKNLSGHEASVSSEPRHRVVRNYRDRERQRILFWFLRQTWILHSKAFCSAFRCLCKHVRRQNHGDCSRAVLHPKFVVCVL